MIVIAGTARVRPKQVAEAVRAGSEMAKLSRGENGCAEYRFAVDIDDPNLIHLFEQWDSEQALQAHFAEPHFAAFGATIMSVLDGPATFTRYDVASAGPLFG